MLKRRWFALVSLLVLTSTAGKADTQWLRRAEVDADVIAEQGGSAGLRAKFLGVADALGVKPGFPDGVEKETKEWLQLLKAKGLDFTGLVDLTALPFITIDNDDSKDLDQAMAILNGQNGGYVFYYAIADAAYFMPLRGEYSPIKRAVLEEDSELDKWARSRMITTYLPMVNIPVLPREFSEYWMSLAPQVERRALVAVINVSKDGNVQGPSAFVRAKIKSRAQLSYRLVQQHFDALAESPYQDREFAQTLANLKSLGEARLARAHARYVVSFPDRDLRFFEENSNYYVGLYQRFEVERWNEQLSNLANAEAARFVDRAKLQVLHRHHRAPQKNCRSHIQRNAYSQNCHECLQRGLATLHAPLSDLRLNQPADLLTFVERLDGSNQQHQAMHHFICRTNYQAEYSVVFKKHYGLHEKLYSHMTAPMRRYVDIMTHRLILTAIARKGAAASHSEAHGDAGAQVTPPSFAELDAVAKAANKARSRENEIRNKVADTLAALSLKPYQGQNLEGVAVYFDRYNMHIALKDFPFNVHVKREDLQSFAGLTYEMDSQRIGCKLYRGQNKEGEPDAQVRLGDSVTLRLHVDHNGMHFKPIFAKAPEESVNSAEAAANLVDAPAAAAGRSTSSKDEPEEKSLQLEEAI